MNEGQQLEAIERELEANGWQVFRAPQAVEFDLPEGLPLLDFFARRTHPDAAEQHLIVEIANRTRYAKKGSGRGRRERILADEDQALERISKISDGLRSSQGKDIQFQIRFLDVSAEQADARKLRDLRVRDNNVLAGELLAALKDLDDRELGKERALLTAFLWCRWLRILGMRFPAKGRKQLVDADIRTIQKDLFDAGIVKLPPADYFFSHQSIAALSEGGDVEWATIMRLDHDLRSVLRAVGEIIGFEAMDVQAVEQTSRGRQGIKVFDTLESAIILAQTDNDLENLKTLLSKLRATDGTPAFRQVLIDFERTIPENFSIIQSFLPALRALTDSIRD